MDTTYHPLPPGPLPNGLPSGRFPTWPFSAQLALALIVVAGLFFLLGRWSHESSKAAVDISEHAGPALDLNRATKAELRLLPGLGDALAQRIVDFRSRHGGFRSIDDLRQVFGIGPKTLDRIRPFLFVATPEQFVAFEESEPVVMQAKPMQASSMTSTSNKAAKLTEPINVNQASQTDLQKLPGIGPKLSQRILDERAKASFKSVEELRRVPGIGPKTLEKLRPFVRVE
jgi:competence protein ComEA